MTVKELIKELEALPDWVDVTLVGTIPPDHSNCQCGDYCYCSYQEVKFSVSQVSSGTTYDKKRNNHVITEAVLIGDRI